MENDSKLTVFENQNDDDINIDFTPEQSRRPWPLLIGGAIAALVLAILITALVMTKPPIDQESANMARAGSAEFEAYKDKVTLEVDLESRIVNDNWIGMWRLQAKAKLSNLGDRELIGVEVVEKLIGHNDNVLANAVRLPIPRDKPGPIKPGESMIIGIGVDAPVKVTEAEVKNITVELRGLRFR
jgi:hypothetical protein